MKQGSSQNIANTVWAYARIVFAASKLFDEVNKARPQSVANMVWAFRETDHAAPNFFVEVKKNTERFVQASDLKGIRIIHTAWAGGFKRSSVP